MVDKTAKSYRKIKEAIMKDKKMRTKLAWIRTSQGLSQGKLAALAGVSKRAIENYEERIRRIDGASGDVLWKLATALGVPMEALMEHDREH